MKVVMVNEGADSHPVDVDILAKSAEHTLNSRRAI
jgi:hypothetical protein